MAEPPVYTLRLSSPPDDVNAVHALLDQVWADSPSISMEDRFSFELALIELAANVIRHADDGTGLTCTLAVETTGHQIVATLVDSGVPGTVDLSRREMPDELDESGRGLVIIKSLVDELEHNIEGNFNRWRISRNLAS